MSLYEKVKAERDKASSAYILARNEFREAERRYILAKEALAYEEKRFREIREIEERRGHGG